MPGDPQLGTNSSSAEQQGFDEHIVLIDANALFAPRQRDLLIHLHVAGVLLAHWTIGIEREWTKAAIRKSNVDAKSIEACQVGMRLAVPSWEVEGYEGHIDRFPTVDAKDRHVAAAAYKLSLDEGNVPVVLLTNNIKDFPTEAFFGTPITVCRPGDYIDYLFSLYPSRVMDVASSCRHKLIRPPYEPARYLEVLVAIGCLNLATALSKLWDCPCPQIGTDNLIFVPSAQKHPAPKDLTSGKQRARKPAA